MRMKFSSLVTRTIYAIEENEAITSERIKHFFSCSGRKDLARSIEDGDSIFTALTKEEHKYWTFFDYDLLDEMIITFCRGKPIMDELTEYKSLFKDYCENRLSQIVPSEGNLENTNPESQIYVKIDSRFFDDDINIQKVSKRTEQTGFSLKDLKRIEARLSELLEIKHLILLNVETGCIELTFHHFEESNPLLSLNTPKKINLALLGVKWISCNNENCNLELFISPPPIDVHILSSDHCKLHAFISTIL